MPLGMGEKIPIPIFVKEINLEIFNEGAGPTDISLAGPTTTSFFHIKPESCGFKNTMIGSQSGNFLFSTG